MRRRILLEHLILCGDSLELIEQVPKKSVDLIVTSPPYWAKRVYNGDGEIGTEPTPEEYVKKMADFFKKRGECLCQYRRYLFWLRRRGMEKIRG